jgi:hypothetical protein
MKFPFLALGLALSLAAVSPARAGGQREPMLAVPAYTAYIEPDPEAMEVSSEKGGVSGWTDAKEKIVWYGELKATGELRLAVLLRLPEKSVSTFRLTVAKQTRTAQTKDGNDLAAREVMLDFGTVNVPAPGYCRIALEGVSKTGKKFGDVVALLLRGPAAQSAHFNLDERRNAASVHLSYPIPPDAKVAAFTNEVTVRADPIWSYYMACGFQRGYFGIQVNSPTERRIIFSVWDSGSEAADRSKVAAEDRVQLVAKGDGVFTDGFGNEGTGGHSHLVYPWKTGQTYRFLVTAQPDGTHTVYSGYFYFPEKRRWGLIASFRAPKDGGWLRGLYSFNENFGGANGQKRRLAEFGNQWIRTADGDWRELVTARFSHDPTGKENRKDYGSGVVKDRFYLSNGGFVAEPVRYGDTVTRPASGRPPTDIAEKETGR